MSRAKRTTRSKRFRIMCGENRAIDVVVKGGKAQLVHMHRDSWARRKWYADLDAGILFDRGLIPEIVGALQLADEEAGL